MSGSDVTGRKSRFPMRVRYADTDPMGVAYYGNYFTWFEVGRTEMLRALGMSYREVEAAGVRLPVVESGCRYLRPARYDDRLVIETTLAEFGRASLRFEYRVLHELDGELLALGWSTHCFLDAAGRLIRPPAFFRELMGRAGLG